RSPACFFSRSGHHRDLHSFPTRRSSDLAVPAAPALGALAAVFSTPAQLAHLAVLGVVCSAFAYLAMNACQPKVTAAEAGMIYCMEPVFAAAYALFLPGWLSAWTGTAYASESLTSALIAGGALVTGANILLPIRPRSGAGSVRSESPSSSATRTPP